MKVWCKIGGTTRCYVMNVDRDIVYDGCNGEVLSDGSSGQRVSEGRWVKVTE